MRSSRFGGHASWPAGGAIVLSVGICAWSDRADGGPSLWEAIHAADVIVLARLAPPPAPPEGALGPAPPQTLTSSEAAQLRALAARQGVRVIERDVDEEDEEEEEEEYETEPQIDEDPDGSGAAPAASADATKGEGTVSDESDGGAPESEPDLVDIEVPALSDMVTRMTFIVEQTWKGRRQASIATWLTIWEGRGLDCPVERTVIVFLEEKEGRLVPTSCLLGDADAAPEAIEALGRQIRRAISIQSKGAVDLSERVDWLVAQIAEPATRRQALYELDPPADRRTYLSEPMLRQPLAPLLTPSQIARIAKVFVAGGGADETLPLFLAVLANHPSREVDDAALARVESALASPRQDVWLFDAIGYTLDRFGDPNRQARVEGALAGRYWLDPVTLRALWEGAKHDLGIPSVGQPSRSGGSASP